MASTPNNNGNILNSLGGLGGGLFGNNNGNGAAGYMANMANNDVGREMLMNAIQGNGNAISNLATSLGCSTDAI
jgi:hypothetical protein